MLQMTSTVLKFHFKSELESASFGKSVLSLRGEGAERTLELLANATNTHAQSVNEKFEAINKAAG